MSKPRKDRIREERIRNEAVVDAYGPEEQAMGWYFASVLLAILAEEHFLHFQLRQDKRT
jgi:hypothetical protein